VGAPEHIRYAVLAHMPEQLDVLQALSRRLHLSPQGPVAGNLQGQAHAKPLPRDKQRADAFLFGQPPDEQSESAVSLAGRAAE